MRTFAALVVASALMLLNSSGECETWTRAEWEASEDGAGMLRAIQVNSGSKEHRLIVLAGCECARLALQYVPEDEDRPRLAIETAEAWARGKNGVTLGDVNEAARAAHDVFAGACAVNTGYAAEAAAYAGFAAFADDAAYIAAANASADAAAAAYFAAYAAAADATDATDRKNRTRVSLRSCADIVRRYFPEPPA